MIFISISSFGVISERANILLDLVEKVAYKLAKLLLFHCINGTIGYFIKCSTKIDFFESSM